MDPPRATVHATNRQLTNSAHRITEHCGAQNQPSGEEQFLFDQEPEHDKDWECDEHVPRDTHQRAIRCPEKCGRHDEQQAIDSQREGQLSRPREHYDHGEDEKCQVVERVGAPEVIREILHGGMCPEPGVAK
jgi:hypothetical protein